ncbi:uncharacterized protein LY89DRAFT_638216 [Mollisia scopiformis]|uniref:DUF7053 domain-containing protein n=1 Tax=Mollisia scopiformis TaxID=149040 RepID=A0A194XPS1_MOLSC|nr:uncharacterized protein LY89DRAFT_638216 [Mollisia scopiformis]KUJ22054.1 hypothetical protein LY89DRAFT_638216 [Mollisia scopiformis]
MSFLNSSTEVKTTTILKPHITRSHVLRLLHNPSKMLALNPIIKSHSPLPDSSSKAFFTRVAPENKPPTTGPEQIVPVYAIVESTDAESSEGGGSWRGGWAKRFIPESITYETSMQNTEEGMISITQAPMGVQSVTRWTVTEKPGEGLVLEKRGKVTSNRMLMTFIKTTIQGSYEKLANDFVIELERMIDEEEQEKKKESEEEVVVEKVT